VCCSALASMKIGREFSDSGDAAEREVSDSEKDARLSSFFAGMLRASSYVSGQI